MLQNVLYRTYNKSICIEAYFPQKFLTVHLLRNLCCVAVNCITDHCHHSVRHAVWMSSFRISISVFGISTLCIAFLSSCVKSNVPVAWNFTFNRHSSLCSHLDRGIVYQRRQNSMALKGLQPTVVHPHRDEVSHVPESITRYCVSLWRRW